MINDTPVPLTQGEIKFLLTELRYEAYSLKEFKIYKKLYAAYKGKKNDNEVLHPDLVYKPALPKKIDTLLDKLDLDYEGTDIDNSISYYGYRLGCVVLRDNKTYFHVDYPLIRHDEEFLEKLNGFLDKCTRVEVIQVSHEDVGRALPDKYYQTVVYKFK